MFTSIAKTQGAQSRKTIRTVVSLILRVAVQHEAIPDNPVRHLDPIEAGSRRPRALTAEERRRFLAWMQGTSDDKEEARAQVAARRRDLPDFVTFMLGTGVRIGEAGIKRPGLNWKDPNNVVTYIRKARTAAGRQRLRDGACHPDDRPEGYHTAERGRS